MLHIVNGVQVDPKLITPMAIKRFLELPKYDDPIEYFASKNRASELILKRRKKFEAAIKVKSKL